MTGIDVHADPVIGRTNAADGRLDPFAELTARVTREIATALVTEQPRSEMAGQILDLARQIVAAAEDPGAVTVADPFVGEDHGTPASSPRNPVAQPFNIVDDEDGMGAWGRVTLPLQYQGPEGRVHGGIIALLLDEVVGRAASAPPGHVQMTRYLNVTYESATPLNEELTVRARVDRTEGRKRFMTGEVRAGDTVCARAEALFIYVPHTRVPAADS